MASKKRVTDPYRIIPRANATERAELRASIEAVGMRNPVIIDEQNNIIDGHERRDACEELGIDWLVGADVRIGLTDIEKQALAIDINLWRRKVVLGRKKCNELIDIYLIANPHLSENQVADLFAVSQATVNRRKKQLIHLHKLARPEKTVGKDGVERRVGQRKKQPARLTVKSKREYDSLITDITEVAGDLSGIVRRPGRIKSQARRKKALASVNGSEVKLPSSIDIRRCDLRNLKVQRASLDLVVTDPPWSLDYLDDWAELGRLAKQWLKPTGILVSYIGNSCLPHFCSVVMEHLRYRKTIALELATPHRAWTTNDIECWRPIVVFTKKPKTRIEIADWLKSPKPEKDYHDWQQTLEIVSTLVQKLSRPKAVICDPFLGTGTTVVAVDLAGEGRRFIGCDILEERVKIAKHRVATEGRRVAG